MQTSLATIGFLVQISEMCLVLLMNYCVSNELRVQKKNRYMKNLHKKVIIDDTGFRVDSVSVLWFNRSLVAVFLCLSIEQWFVGRVLHLESM